MRESPRFLGRRIGLSAQEVYDKWIDLGLIKKYEGFTQGGYKCWGWHITDLGKSLGGKLSDQGTPTFDYESIQHLM